MDELLICKKNKYPTELYNIPQQKRVQILFVPFIQIKSSAALFCMPRSDLFDIIRPILIEKFVQFCEYVNDVITAYNIVDARYPTYNIITDSYDSKSVKNYHVKVS